VQTVCRNGNVGGTEYCISLDACACIYILVLQNNDWPTDRRTHQQTLLIIQTDGQCPTHAIIRLQGMVLFSPSIHPVIFAYSVTHWDWSATRHAFLSSICERVRRDFRTVHQLASPCLSVSSHITRKPLNRFS
jgi:hypothetical protein